MNSINSIHGMSHCQIDGFVRSYLIDGFMYGENSINEKAASIGNFVQFYCLVEDYKVQ